VKYFLIFNDDNTTCGYTGESKNRDDNAIEVTEEIFNNQERAKFRNEEVILLPKITINGSATGPVNGILKYTAFIPGIPEDDFVDWVIFDKDDGMDIITRVTDDVENGVSEVSFSFDEAGLYLILAESASHGCCEMEVSIL
jgi:hypothetical protein